MSSSSERASRVVAAVRVSWAVVLLAAPGRVVLQFGGADEPASRRVLRLLGARHAVQGTVELFGTGIGGPGAVVDLLHALSALGFGLADRRWRRPALTDAAVAAAFSAAGFWSRSR